jgi:hypothetical protein
MYCKGVVTVSIKAGTDAAQISGYKPTCKFSGRYQTRDAAHSCIPEELKMNVEAPDLLPYYTREEEEQLGLDNYETDTFSSDYDEFVAEFGTELDAHGA